MLHFHCDPSALLLDDQSIAKHTTARCASSFGAILCIGALQAV
jgi:hypothetical protein